MSQQIDMEIAERIKAFVADHYKVDITLQCRERKITFPRKIAISFIKHKTRLSLKEIAAMFGYYDHSTVINALRGMDEIIQTEPDSEKEIQGLYLTMEGMGLFAGAVEKKVEPLSHYQRQCTSRYCKRMDALSIARACDADPKSVEEYMEEKKVKNAPKEKLVRPPAVYSNPSREQTIQKYLNVAI